MSFEKLMKEKDTQFEAMQIRYKEMTKKSFGNDDERLWYPGADKAGNGSAVIRFLPHKETGGVPWVQEFKHSFKGPTGTWLIETCPTTLKKKCPICEENTKLWNSGYERDKGTASAQKRKVYYYSNIYVMNDPGNPENNNKVKIFRYGQKIFEKLNALSFPEFEDQKPINPFHFMHGATFRLRFKKGANGFRSYDHSDFDATGPLLEGNEEKLEKIYNEMFNLDEFVSDDKIKSYDDLKSRYELVTAKSKLPPTEEEESVLAMRDESPFKEETVTGTTAVDFDDESGNTDFAEFFNELNK